MIEADPSLDSREREVTFNFANGVLVSKELKDLIEVAQQKISMLLKGCTLN